MEVFIIFVGFFVGFLYWLKSEQKALEKNPDYIASVKASHSALMDIAYENATNCPLCKGKSIHTTWRSTGGGIGKIGRITIYICSECGTRWELPYPGVKIKRI